MNKPTLYATKVAVPLPSEEDVRKAMGETYKAEVLNVTKMLTGTGDCFPAVVALVKALFQAYDVDPKLREIVTLRVAVLLSAPYEWQQNAKMALNVGLSQEQIEAIAGEGQVQGLTPDYALGCAAADELVRGGMLTDETLSGLLGRYGEVGTRKLVLAIGYFTFLAMFLNGCRVPLETSDKIGASTSPLGCAQTDASKVARGR